MVSVRLPELLRLVLCVAAGVALPLPVGAAVIVLVDERLFDALPLGEMLVDDEMDGAAPCVRLTVADDDRDPVFVGLRLALDTALTLGVRVPEGERDEVCVLVGVRVGLGRIAAAAAVGLGETDNELVLA